MDATCGAAVFQALVRPITIATLDLRIDYLKPGTPPHPLTARAECFKATHNVAFVRATAYHADPADPIAAATATFMITHRGQSAPERGKP